MKIQEKKIGKLNRLIKVLIEKIENEKIILSNKLYKNI